MAEKLGGFVPFIAQLDHVSRQVDVLLADIQGTPPQHLFHYTNSIGLRGIVQRKKIWATHYRFLNDASEIDYGLFVLGAVVDELKARYKDPLVLRFLESLLQTADMFEEIDCYIACFCCKDDLLHQWRDYAGGGGYAIGFRSSALLEASGYGDKAEPDFQLRKVIYDPKVQGELIRKTLEWTIAEIQKFAPRLAPEEIGHLVEGGSIKAQTHLVEFLTMFKHSSFEAEHEWRLCHLTHNAALEHIQFRDGQFGLTPFVELVPFDLPSTNLPIDLITHAPTKDANNVRFALRALLRSSGYDDEVKLKGSIIPIRSR